MAGLTEMQGPRLEFVLRRIDGSVMRNKHSWDPTHKKIIPTPTKQDAGFMLYLPSGQSYRLTEKQVQRMGYARQPEIINFEKANDTKTPAGRFKHAINEADKKKAWTELEDEIVKRCIRRHGPLMKTEKETGNDRKAA